MFYRFVRAVVSFALRLFWRVRVQGKIPDLDGPVIYVGNHPNSLIDPALVFVITNRHVTFLAKAPLFKTPAIAQILKGLDALPVYRKQDDPTQMNKNEGTFEAAANALRQGRAITLFPEGRSHSEPSLGEIKTGAARIALRAASSPEARSLKIVPVGLTYEQKHRFRSEVLIDVGEVIDVARFIPTSAEDEARCVRELTDAIASGLRKVTLNLSQWEDLPLIKTAEALYAFRLGEGAGDAERLRRFAGGVEFFRREQPERFERLRGALMEFKRRLDLVHADPTSLTLVYRRSQVYRFIGRNVASLFLGFPLFLLGVVLYFIPFQIPRVLARVLKVDLDLIATVKFSAVLVLAPLWWGGMTVAAWLWLSQAWGIFVLLAALPLALHTRYFLERWRGALEDILTFLTLGRRASLKARLLVEGERLSAEVETVAAEYRPRVVGA